jgi:hypothetical protein
MIFRIAFLLCASAVSPFASAQITAAPVKQITVSLAVSAPDSIKDKAISFLMRELRALGDIEVIDAGAAFRIEVVALDLWRPSKVNEGYAVSTTVAKPVRLTTLETLKFLVQQGQRSNAEYDAGLHRATERDTAGAVRILGHYLQIAPAEGLAELCEDLVATIDGGVFEMERSGMRKAKQEVEKMLNDTREQKK